MQELSRGNLRLIEDSPDYDALILRAIKTTSIKEEVVTVRGGVEAFQYLFNEGDDAEPRADNLPRAVFLDLKLKRMILGGV